MRPDKPCLRLSGRRQGFARHDLFLAAAGVLVALALVVPRLLQGQWKGAILALLALAGLVLGGLGLLLAGQWLHDHSEDPVPGWPRLLSRLAGVLARFLLFGSIGAVIGSGLAANHQLGARGENLAACAAGSLTGLLGTGLYLRVGKVRFWPAFGWFALALLGSFIGGILGLLVPGAWGVDLGILIPLSVFVLLAATGRIVREPSAPPPST